jgi:hypothetical protein
MKTKITISIIILILWMNWSISQEIKIKDPLSKYKNFNELAISVNGTRVNTNFTTFKTKNGIYNFEKNKYLPSYDILINFGWYLKDNYKSIWILKTGINFNGRSANLVDSIGTDLRYYESLIQIPLQFGSRQPLKYNTIKNNLFRAIEYSMGIYAAIPLSERLDLKNNLDGKEINLSFGNYMRFGFIADLYFTALNELGYGHKIGIRMSFDFNSLVKFKATNFELYPYYNTFGIIYNLDNEYSKKRISNK